ncbi:Signal transduction histidine kinase [Nannocystis exedens]|uniref:histidine kinase n=1 Tax=Nannocystis exedens TaxID=54 RepID=A0A1I2FU96_9BACT|nr:hybrid sensor histidine kinase/response regulator [Nannocystis exedens]PCC73714.1 hybrid sensor histidine kinase/response regulator [Nannocystis exedens]SFF08533.1 Signal transduction histidine kinase [Nannocystis exedens]
MTASEADAALAERVAVLAPFGRDAAVVERVLVGAGLRATTVADVAALLAVQGAGVGVMMIVEEALTPPHAAALAAALAAQPAWSDLPVLLLLADVDGPTPAAAPQVAALCSAGNVTVLARPVAGLTLVTAVQSALRARRRQYEVRDLIFRERAAREEAETATRLKDEFLATVSHELRTPLNTIMLWGQLLAGGRVKPPDMPRALRAIETSARAQSLLIEDLLDVARMLSGKLRVQLREDSLLPAAQAALEVVRPMAQAKSVRLDAQLDPSVGPVLADPDRMQQVLWNLLSNAVKFTPAGGSVTLSLTRDGDDMALRVADTGAGIRRDFLPHVFDRFRQADPTTTRAHGGLGLGLAIVRQLVELHAGSVTAESPGEGAGSVFTVRLPLVDRRAPPAASRPSAPARPLIGVRALLVEDDPDTRRALCLVLEDAGAEVTSVASAPAARAALDAARPDVLLCDIGMPGEDGYALLRSVRAHEQSAGDRPVPAAALTAYTRDEDRRRALACGFQTHLAKPIEPDLLVATVRALARAPRAA